ncbi:MAG TPA: glycosyltransferase family 39 protein [Pyrinomonadaceae bacterium]|nr:glycosyltransferase family 39 protein [Pyrinomonadaceae bacterium]
MLITEKIRKNFYGLNTLSIIYTGIGILGVLLFSIILSRIIYPFDNGYYEAFNWMPAAHLLEGKNPYAYALTPPYSMTPYGIVFYALLAIGVKLFGFQLWWGRILSVAGLAVCVWAVLKITKKLTGSREAGWAACLACLAMFAVEMWVGVVRSDLIAAAFAFVSVWLAFDADEKSRISFPRLFAIALLLTASFFTKHTFLLPVLIIILRFLQLKKITDAVKFLSVYAILVAAGMFLLNDTSAGGYIWQHFLHAQELPYSLDNLTANLLQILKSPTMIIFGIFLLIFAYENRDFFRRMDRQQLINRLRSPKLLILLYFFLSFGMSSISSGRVGASVNYYIENSFVIAIIWGLIYEDFKQKAMPRLALAMIVLLSLGGIFQLFRASRGEYFRWQSLSYYREISETTAKFTPPGSTCFSVYVELVVRSGCAFEFDDFGEYTGNWSPVLSAIFEKEVRAGRFAVIIWDSDKLQTRFPNYRLVPMTENLPERFTPVYLYVRETGQLP